MDSKGGVVSQKTPDPPGWLKMVVGLVIATSVAAAGGGHVESVPAAPPTTVCASY